MTPQQAAYRFARDMRIGLLRGPAFNGKRTLRRALRQVDAWRQDYEVACIPPRSLRPQMKARWTAFCESMGLFYPPKPLTPAQERRER